MYITNKRHGFAGMAAVVAIAVLVVFSLVFFVHNSSNATSAPVVKGIAPATGPIGTTVVLSGSGFMKSPMVNFGSGVIANVQTNVNHTQLTFVVPAFVNPACTYSNPPCNLSAIQVTSGTYQVSITNGSATSNSANFTVTQ